MTHGAVYQLLRTLDCSVSSFDDALSYSVSHRVQNTYPYIHVPSYTLMLFHVAFSPTLLLLPSSGFSPNHVCFVALFLVYKRTKTYGKPRKNPHNRTSPCLVVYSFAFVVPPIPHYLILPRSVDEATSAQPPFRPPFLCSMLRHRR